MNDPEADPPASPFHGGESAVQQRLGVRPRVEQIGQRIIRDHLTEEHREFFPQLPALLLASRDAAGALWASVLCGQPGFVHAPDPRRLAVAALPLPDDPLHASLGAGARLGLLGIQFHTRRRNRVSGRVERLLPDGFLLQVDQSFGNCPKYIQSREPEFTATTPGTLQSGTQLTAADAALIAAADTFFIASGIEGAADDPRAGLDVSHRGGRPGFVRVENGQLTWPDFIGNFMFNTLGNLMLDPRAGLLFMDFETGDTLQLSGRAEVLWDTPERPRFAGAQRFLRYTVESVRRRAAALPLRWQFDEASPFLAGTGRWQDLD